MTDLESYAKRMDARPLPTDVFTVTLTRSQLEWFRGVVRQQVLSERKQMEYYIKRDAQKHPERKTVDRFKSRLETAQDVVRAINEASRI